MYRHCIYCSANLGANDALEAFPVGRTVAIDAANGRLWAICRQCARWNLAPIEERWEAVESAERLFTDTRLRVQRENVGIAKLRDGTRLVRVGEALPGELAAWRYGDEFARRERRSRRYRGVAAAVSAGGLAAWGLGAFGVLTGAWAAAGTLGTVVPGLLGLGQIATHERRVYRLVTESGAAPVVLRLRDLNGVKAGVAATGELRVVLPRVYTGWIGGVPRRVKVSGERAVALLARTLAVRNTAGAAAPVVDAAFRVAGESAGPEAAVRALVASRAYAVERGRGGTEIDPGMVDLGIAVHHLRQTVGVVARKPFTAASDHETLALEMSLHESEERRALQGELTILESAWREAEEIASIARPSRGRGGARPLTPSPVDADGTARAPIHPRTGAP